jgi:glycosyltransferase involved in cell wall biosynthesis
MKTIQLVTPENFQWLSGYLDVLRGYNVFNTKYPCTDDSDMMIFLWCNQETINYIMGRPKTQKYIVYVRRYELFSGLVNKLDWDLVDHIVFVNYELAKIFITKYPNISNKLTVIYNGVNPDKWDYREHSHGKKIAMVGWINQKKNYPLALQVLGELPSEYELHIAGGNQDDTTCYYLANLAKDMGVSIIFHGRQHDMNNWYQDKDYLLSCAISEGCPNNVIEAMACGIKPIIHNWPDANRQFPGFVFNTVAEATRMIDPSADYDSSKYRQIIKDYYSSTAYLSLRSIVENLFKE